MPNKAKLVLADGTEVTGSSFGHRLSAAGEVVFNTGLVGYPESLSDPSYYGQILVLTYPLVGNYGIPSKQKELGLLKYFESERAQIAGLIVNNYSPEFSHYLAKQSLGQWLNNQKIPALTGVDTRFLTQKLRQSGTMLGKIIVGHDIEFFDPNARDVIDQVSIKKPVVYGRGKIKLLCLDCGVKNNIIREFVKRGTEVWRVPYDFNFLRLRQRWQGAIISNGPGNPANSKIAIGQVKKLIHKKIPIFGICLGAQLLALAVGAKTYKLKFGHRSQNQPCQELESKKCYITSQNHGYAIDRKTLNGGWRPWFENLNDNSVEGIKHQTLPFMAVQFHPEAAPGPADTAYLFDLFLSKVKRNAK